MIAKTIFWAAVSVIFYAYFGYHLLVRLMTFLVLRKAGNSTPPVDKPIPVSVIVTVHNEARVTGKRIENLLALQYPREMLEIIIASDGSTDRTVEIAWRYHGRGITVLDLPRMGKGPAQNEAVAQAKGDIVVLTDADTEFDREFVREVVSHFLEDSRVGCVIGNLSWKVDSTAPSKFRELYWRFELDLRDAESRLGNLASGCGAAMAVRRDLWKPMTDSLDDPDNITPLDVILQGSKVKLAENALALEVPFSSPGSDCRSKMRAASKWLVTVPRRWGFRNIFRHPLISWTLFSHFFARWMGAYFILAAILSSLFLSRRGLIYECVLFIEILLIWLVLIGYIGERLHKRIYVAGMVFSLAVVNLGFALGILKGALGAARGPFETE
jgi:cellulose synthase/poly-beta-1,6-N-acetylglucosamine synthase-like glycosyltransferase